MADVRYPSYKDMDPFVDVERLKQLDAFIADRLRHRLALARDLQFYTGPFVLEAQAPVLPGSRMVELSRSRNAADYYDLDRADLWTPTEESEEFAPLMDFIATLPFAATARIIIMYDPHGRAVSAHKDHDSQDLCHEFIWFRTNLAKPFYMLDPGTGERLTVASHSAWFDTVNQFHGADATGELAFSIRVDGRFTDELRKHIPFPATNRAASPSLWAHAGHDDAQPHRNTER
jgi:hypothetical protein